MNRLSPIPILLALLLLLAACGSSDDSGSAGGGQPAQTTTADPTESTTTARPTDSTATTEPTTTATPTDSTGPAPTMRVGWGFPGEELKYLMIGRPDLFPNIGTCYQPEWQRFTGTAEQVQGMATGTLDGGTVALLTFPRAIEQGVDLVLTNALVEETTDGFSISWMAKEGTTLEELRGAKIGTNAIGASNDYFVGSYLQEAGGLAFNQDYELVEVPFPQMADALATGLVDVAPMVQPFYGNFIAGAGAEGYEALFTNTDVLDPVPQLQHGFTRSYLESEPEAVACFADDVAAAADFVLDPGNRTDVLELTSDVSELPTAALEPYLLLPELDLTRPERSAIDVAALQAAWDLFAEAGVLSGDHRVEEFVVEGVSYTR